MFHWIRLVPKEIKIKIKLFPRQSWEKGALLRRAAWTSGSGFCKLLGMVAGADDFSTYYAGFIEGSYDCPDRIVVNAYNQLVQTGGGFRTFWRTWQGSDKKLSDSRLKSLAGDCARRLKAWCQKNQVPWVECQSGEVKYEIARELLPENPRFRGVFAVLVGRAPAPIWQVRRNQAGQITDLCRPDSWPHVQHYYFQIMDPDWGHLVVRLCGYPPWGAQVILNGHGRVERLAQKRRIAIVKEGNCFIEGSHYPKVEKLASTLMGDSLKAELEEVCKRWLYTSCLCFALPVAEQKRCDFNYRFSVWQLEYSRNWLFRDGKTLEELFQKVLDRTRAPLDIKVLETIFGRRHRQPNKPKERAGRSEVKVAKEVDHRQWDTTVLRVRWGNLLLKMYDKSGRVLRTEVVVQNTRELRCGKGLDKLPEQLEKMRGLLLNFLNSVQAAHVSFLDGGQFEAWHEPTQRGSRRLAGIDLNKARNRTVVEAVTSLSTMPEGFTVEELAQAVRERTGWSAAEYSKRRAAYDLAKLRGKELVQRCPGRRRYQCLPKKLRVLCGYVVLRERVIKPLLAGMTPGDLKEPPGGLHRLDHHYLNLQAEMHRTFETLGLAA
jgi:hypothetical protein